jgi:hypothetical protein
MRPPRTGAPQRACQAGWGCCSAFTAHSRPARKEDVGEAQGGARCGVLVVRVRGLQHTGRSPAAQVGRSSGARSAVHFAARRRLHPLGFALAGRCCGAGAGGRARRPRVGTWPLTPFIRYPLCRARSAQLAAARTSLSVPYPSLYIWASRACCFTSPRCASIWVSSNQRRTWRRVGLGCR